MLGVRTRQGEIAAGRTAIAVAGHTSHVAAMAGLKLPVESHLLQAFVSEPIKPFVDHVISFGAELFYISQSDKGGLVFGGHIDGFNNYTQRGQFAKVQEVAQCAVALIPSVSRLRLLRHWAGIQDMTPDGSPFICRTSVRNLFLNGGWCYQGFKATPASGWCLAHTIAHDEEHPLNRDFGLDRFERGGELDEHGVGNWTYKTMRIICPVCGERDYTEFRYGGDASKVRPTHGTSDMKAWYEYVFVFGNPKGLHREYWQHVMGCRQWLVLERNTATNEVAQQTRGHRDARALPAPLRRPHRSHPTRRLCV